MVSYKFKKYSRLQLDLFKSRFVSHSDLAYAWPMFCDLWDDLRAFNDRKGDSKLEALNPMFEAQLDLKLATIPKPPKKHEPLHVDFFKNIRSGGMSGENA